MSLARGSRWLRAAIGVAGVQLGVAAFLRIALRSAEDPPLPQQLFAVLVAAASLCVAALAARRSPGLAWFCLVTSASLAAIEVVGALRRADLVADAGSDPWATAVAMTSFALCAVLGAAYAARPDRGRPTTTWERLVVAGVLAATVATVVACVWAIAVAEVPFADANDGELAPARATGRLALATVEIALVVGVLRGIAPAARRALATSDAAGAGTGRGFLLRLADELSPARSAAREAEEAERARLAADLHAVVLPELRRAAAAADAAAAPEGVRLGVRRALADAERLMHGRQSIVLEHFGLLAALEWLAERTEEDGGIRVVIEPDGDRLEDAGTIAPSVGRAAFRIALLALDNVVRHAGASTATIGIRVASDGLVLTVADDGRAAPAGSHGRGFADMEREAATSGGRVRISTDGTIGVAATWPRPMREDT